MANDHGEQIRIVQETVAGKVRLRLFIRNLD